jgi:YidC/Oxa1 family membrane protein insertase
MNPNKNQMNQGETRNLIIFMVVSLLLYFAYNTFVLQPQAEIRRQQAAATAQETGANTVLPQIEAQDSKIVPVSEALSGQSRLKINNEKISGSISLTGARIDNLSLKDYFKTLDSKENVNVLAPAGTEFPRSIEYGWVAGNSDIITPNADTIWSITGNGGTLSTENDVTLSWTSPQNIEFRKTFSIDDQYVITVQQSVVNNTVQAVTLYPYGILSQKGLPSDFEGRFISHEGPIAYAGGTLEDPEYKHLRKDRKSEFSASEGWIGFTDKYWLTALMPAQDIDTKFRFLYTGTPPKKKEQDTGRYQADYTGAAVTVESGTTASVESRVFAGPKRVLMLKDYSEKLGVSRLDLSVDFGIFWFLTVPFFYGLHYLALAVGNVGVAIILLTLIVRTLVSPLTYTSYKSFAKMKKVMPEVNKLRQKYGNTDKQKLQQEMLALYQKEGVNPAAGCLPILLQIPIFFAFYKILFVTIEIRHEPFFGWINDLAAPDPTSIFNLFGLIPWDPPGFLMIGVWPCLMLLAMQIQRRLNPPPADPIQRDMALWFPFMMTFIMAHFASGLVIYWTVSAFFGVAQQAFIMRKMGVPIHLFGESEEDKAAESMKDLPHPEKLGPYSISALEEDIVDEIKHIRPPKPRKKKKK